MMRCLVNKTAGEDAFRRGRGLGGGCTVANSNWSIFDGCDFSVAV